jgi:hypothetical protein
MDSASGYLEGSRSGEGIVQTGVNAFDRARQWRDRLSAQAEEHKAAAEALKTEAARYADKMKLETDAAGEKKAETYYQHGRDTITDAADSKKLDETVRHNKAVEGEYSSGLRGTRAPAIPPEVKAAMSNRDSARKAISALAAGGIPTPPPDLQAKLDAAEGALSRVARKNSFDLGEDATTTEAFHKSLAAMQAKAAADADAKAHPVKTWFKSLTSKDSTPAAAKLRTATNPTTGEKTTESYPGEWGQ